jgi:hypothetical protein
MGYVCSGRRNAVAVLDAEEGALQRFGLPAGSGAVERRLFSRW